MAAEVTAGKSKKKRIEWTEGSEIALLDLWPERIEELRGQRKNGHIYAEMADELSKLGYLYSSRDVQVKLQNFTQRYRKEKAVIGVSGGSPSLWPHYNRVHEIIGSFKANLFNELVIESIDEDDAIVTPSLLSSIIHSSPSPVPNTSVSAVEPPKKKIKDFKTTILQNFENLSGDIAEHLKKSEHIEKELISIERKKADTLEKIAKDNEELKNALISFLNKN